LPVPVPAPTLIAEEPIFIAGEEAELPVPTYRTRIPPAATLRYDLRRGLLAGTATLEWAPSSTAYEARFEARLAGLLLLAQTSRGGFDTAGLAPARFTDQRLRRSTLAANFQRDAGKLTFSGNAAEFALAPGMQDRLSWLFQLAAIAEADPAALTPGAEFAIKLAGARGDVSVWHLRVRGPETLRIGDASVATIRISRAARGTHDSGAEVWLDPKRHHLPVRVALNTPAEGDGRPPLELELKSIEMPP
jgi:hypothetical protein